MSSASGSAAASDNLSNVLGSIGSNTDSASATGSNSGSASVTSASGSSGSATATSAAASNTITDAPNLSSATSGSVSSLTDAPSLTSGGAPTLTGLPTLSGYYSYPPPSVPPTSDAPYMQRTNLPENFVFIVVGACIAFVALVIIAWRILTSWSINRRFRRHEGPGGSAVGKVSYTALSDTKHKPQTAPSSHEMKDVGTLPRNFSSVPSLYFSPTAEVARHSGRPPGSRDASYGHLPAGHYRDASRT